MSLCPLPLVCSQKSLPITHLPLKRLQELASQKTLQFCRQATKSANPGSTPFPVCSSFILSTSAQAEHLQTQALQNLFGFWQTPNSGLLNSLSLSRNSTTKVLEPTDSFLATLSIFSYEDTSFSSAEFRQGSRGRENSSTPL